MANPVHTVQNDVDDRDRVFRVHVQNGTGDVRAPVVHPGSSVGGRKETAWLIIRDDDPTVVTLRRDDSGAIQEGGAARERREALFTVSLSRKLYGSSDRIEVPIRISGNVTLKDVDVRDTSGPNVVLGPFHQVLSRDGGGWRREYYEGTLSFFMGSQSATLIASAVDDDEDEGDELMAVELGSTADFARQRLTHIGGGAIPDPNSNGVIIRINDNDNDPPDPPANRVLVTLHSDRIGWVEGKAGTGTLRVSISRLLASGERIDVPLALSSNTGAQLTGARSVFKSIALAAATKGVSLEDATTASPKLIFRGPSATSASVRLTHNAALNDDDLTPERVEARLGDLGAAGLGTDVVGAVSPSDDGDPATEDNLVTIVIADDQDQPTATLSPASSSVHEGDDAVLTVTLSKVWPVDRNYQWYTKPLAGKQPDTSDYAAVPRTSAADITVAASETTATLTVRTKEDNVREDSEVLHVGLLEVRGGSPQEIASAKVTIMDSSENFIVKPTNVLVAEADDPKTPVKENEATLTVRFAARPRESVMIVRPVVVDDTVATIVSPEHPHFLFFIGEGWKRPQTITVRAVDDAVDNPGNKRVTQIALQILYSRDSGRVNPPPVRVGLTVTDDDAAPSGITLTASPDSVKENASPTTVTVTAAVTGATTYGEDKTVAVAVGNAGDTAVEGTDYASVADRKVTIRAGKASAAVTFTLAPTNDNVDEEDETISVTGTSGTLAVTGDEITVTDDDDEPKISITSVVNTFEGSGGKYTTSLAFGIGLDRHSSKRVSFSYKVEDVEATAGVDYGDSFTTDHFPANEQQALVIISVIHDTMFEPDERVRLTLTGATNAVLGKPVTATATIKNDDPFPGITIGDTVVTEGEVARFPVTLTNAHYQGVKIDWYTAPPLGTGFIVLYSAWPGKDYVSVSKDSAERLTIGPGKTTGTIDVQTLQDTEAEGIEDFAVRYHPPTSSNINYYKHGAKAKIIDDESAHVRVDDATVVEAGKAAFRVWLTKAAGSPVTVSWRTKDDAEGSNPASGTDYTAVSDSTVTFAAGETVATIEVQTTHDVVAEPAETFRVSLIKTSSSSSVSVPVSPTHGEAVGTITDDDVPNVTLWVDTDANADGYQDSVKEDAGATEVSVMARLGGTARFSEKKTVVVTVGKAGDGAKSGSDYLQVKSFPIVFWPTRDPFGVHNLPAGHYRATFTLTPKEDDLVEGSESLSVDGALSGVKVTGDTITITDVTGSTTGGLKQDAPRIDLSASPGSVGESAGGTAIKVTATLAGTIRFAKPVVVAVAVGASGDTATAGADYGAVANFEIRIPGEKASGSKTFTLTPTDDAVSEGDEKLSVTGTADGIDVSSAQVTIEDDEALPEVTLVLTPSTINESGTENTSTVTAKLAAESSEAVTLQVSAEATDSLGFGNFSLSTDRKLTIGAGALKSTGTVTIDAVENATDTEDTVVVVEAKVSGGNGVAAPSPVALIIKDDDVRNVKVSASRLVVMEAPDPTVEDEDEQTNKAMYSVVLGTQPTGPVTIDVANSHPSTVVVSPTRLTFARARWNRAQTVTVTGVDDSVVNPEGVRTAQIKHAVGADDTDYEEETAPALAVGVMDDDRNPDRVLLYVDTGGSLRDVIAEGAGATNVTVVAGIQGVSRFDDAKTVTVAVGKVGDSAVEGTDYGLVSEFDITIPAGAASGKTTFTLTPTDDSIIESVESLSVTGTLTGVTVVGEEIRIIDDDTAGLVIDPTAVTVAEADDPETPAKEHQGTYTVALAAEPSADVTVAITGQASTDVSVDDASLTFTVEKWNEAQTVTVTAAEDDDASNDEVTLKHTASGGDYGSVVLDVVVTVEDDDSAGLVVAPAAVTVAEADDPKTDGEEHKETYTVKLATEPSADVTVAITGQASTDVSVDEASLTFTVEKWNEAQTVTVTAAEDADASNDEVTLKHTASGGDYGSVELDVVVTVSDDDSPGLVVAPAAVTVAEADDPATQNISEHQGTYTVALAAEPSADVTVAITGQADTDVSVDAATLTFTVEKWNEAQTVTVTAAEDADASNDEVTLKHTASGGDYGSVELDVVVTVSDDDSPGLVVAPAAVTVAEADDPATQNISEHQGTYTVKLATEPSADVTVVITGQADTDVSVDEASLTFTVAKWNEAQTVTVTAAEDDDASNDEVTLKHTASGGDYGTVVLDVVVTVEDDDTVGLVVDPAAVTVAEADDPATQNISEHQGTYTVKLATEPSADVTVAITGQASTDVSVDEASLTFTVEKWSEAQTVTVTAAEDDDASNDEVTLKHTASGGDYGSVELDVVVTVSDDDSPGLVVAPAAVTIAEADDPETPAKEHQGMYTVALATEPSADVTVAVTGQASTDVSVDEASLTFTVEKWSEAQTVTVTAGEDADASNDEVTLKHTARGGDYGSVVLDVGVTVEDDDTVGLVVDPAALTVAEADDPKTTETAEHQGTYTVKLATEPSADVTVAITGQAGTDVSVDEASLTFTVEKWSEAQTVTVTAGEDADASNDEVTLKHTASGGDYGSVELDVGVTVEDDDTVGLVVNPAALTVAEADDPGTPAKEHQGTYTVKLATEPSADVTVAITGQASTDVSVDEASLTFTVEKWSEAQTVTVTAAEDADASNDEVTLKHTASGGDYGSVELDVVVTVSDDDSPGLVVAPAAVTVAEADDPATQNISEHQGTYTVKLATEPSADVTVVITGQADTDVSVDEASLTFTVAKWNEAQTVTVTAAEDDDAANDLVTLKHTASGGDYGSVELDVVVTVEDDDSPGLVVAPAAVTVAEADDPATQNISEHQGTYTVKLATEPSADVTVAITGQASTDVSVDEASLTFTVAKWNEAQTVTVTAAEDDDAANDLVTLKHTASGGDYGTVVLDVVVTVEDDDTAGLVIDPAAVTVAEADDPATPAKEHQGTYTVALATEPSADVTVAVAGHAGSDLTLDTESLTFTVAKWSEAQTVTVTAGEDADASNDEVTLKHTASGGDYGTVVLDVVVTVSDDDSPGLVVAPAAVTVAEADDPETPAKEHQGMYTVALATEPSADVTVAVTGQADTDVSVDEASLTFTVAKWNEAQTVTVTAAEDADASNDEVTLKHTASGGDYGTVVLDVGVTVSDDDSPGLVVAPAAVTVAESDDPGTPAKEHQGTYTVKLATEPSADVTVAVAGHAGSDLTLDKESLTFTVAKWNEAQTVTVTAAEDADASNDLVTLKHTASGGDYGSVVLDVVVTVSDDDTVGLVVDPVAVTVAEADDPATQNNSEHQGTYTVKLASEPSADVTVAITGQASTDVSVDEASLTFTVEKWSEAQTVTVTAAEDDDASNDEVTLKHTASGGDYGSVELDVVVTVSDDDSPGLVVAPAAVTVAEADDPETPAKEHQGMYTVALATEPSADVTVAVTGQASTDVSVDEASLTFTVEKWSEAQTVTVTAGEDADASNDEVTLKHTARGGDYGSVVLDVGVTVEDDDTVGLVVDPAALTVAEADDPKTTETAEHQGTYTVALASEPSADVTVAVAGHAGSDLTLDTESLTFTVAKWSEAQTVTVTAAEDDDASNDLVTLKHTASGGDYGSVVLDVVVTVEDDDTVGLVIDPTALTVAEADDPATQNISEHQGTYTVKLATEPSADVTVVITGQASTDVSVDEASLTFTVAKWSEAQTVTVTAAEDADASNDEVTLKHTASGGDYGSVELDVVVTVSDDDSPGLVVAPAAVTVAEADDPETPAKEHQGTYTVKLATEPSADVTVAVTGQADTDVSVDEASLTFTVEKWNEAQTVTVTAAEDADASNDEVTLKHTASGGDYGSVELDVVVTVSDDDSPGLVVAPAAVTVAEADDPATQNISEHQGTYTVKLATEPSADVTVVITGQADTDVSVDDASLTFTVEKWNEAQTVTVTASQDDDASNDEVTLKHTASGGDYGSVVLDVVVTVSDDDSAGLVVAPAAVTVGEGADATYTVKLATEPSADVTVAVAGQADTDVSVDEATLTFTVAKWNEAQTVTVTAAEDADASNDEVTLKHTASGGDYGSVVLDVGVTVEDDDTVDLVVAPAAVTVAEADDTATPAKEHQGTYTVKLATEPSADVTVAITGQAGTDVSVDDASLTFTVAKWNEAQTVTVTAAEDDDASNDEVTLKHTASGGDYGSVVLDVVVTVEDDDTVGLVVDPAALTVAEADDPATQSIAEHQGTYTVALATEPSADVTVAVAGHAGSDLTLDTESLTFTVAKWSEAQTVTVTAGEDADASNDEVTLKHTASGGDYGTVVLDVVVTVSDDDSPGLVVAPAAVTVAEADDPETPAKEHQGMYTVALATEPSADVTVAVTGQADTDVSVDEASLTFTVAKWNEAQTVTVTAAEDADASNDEVTLKHTASGGDYGTVVLDVGVTVSDDDSPGLVVAPAAVTVAESDDPETPAKEHQGTYTVKLATEPSADVTVAVTGQADTDVSVDEASLTFTVEKWNEAQTVTVTAAEDADASNDEVTLKHTASGGDYGSVELDVVVTVSDDDSPGLVVAPAAVTVAEADDPATQNISEHQGTYTVKLATEPSADVTVVITGQADTDVSVDEASLTFTVEKWSEAQTVTVTAAEDADASNDEVTLKHTASGGDYGSVELDVVVTVSDDDSPGLVVAPAAVTVAEADDPATQNISEHQGTYTVKLASEPSADVTVAVAGHAGSDLTLDKESLTFTVAKWNEAQTVTVTAAEDADASNDLVTLKHTASGGDYGSVVLDVVVTVSDDDTVGLVVDPVAVTVAEADDPATQNNSEHQGTYTVKLASEPSADVTVAVAGHAGSDLTLDKESLTFTVAKWNEAQTVTVTAAEDADASNDLVTLKHTASGGDYGSVVRDVGVTVEDDDTVGLVVDPAAVTVAEADDTATPAKEHQGTYTVKLATEPSADVTVAITGQAGTDVSVDDASLTFTASAWGTAQTVTVTAAEDADASNDEVTLKHTASGGDYGSVTADVVVTVEDDDEAPTGITLSAVPDSVTENGGAQTITVTAAVTGGRYTEAQTVTVSVSDGTAESPADYAAVADFDITIGAGAGSASGSFTLTPVDDAVDEGDETIAVTGVSGALTITPETITITDDDEAPTGITLSAVPDSVTENGGAQTITVTATVNGATRYATAQTVTVNVGGGTAESPADYAAVADFDITIGAGVGSASGSITLTPVDDTVDEGDETIAVTGVSGSLTIISDTITITDNDTVGLVVKPSAVTVGEGASASYTVALATEPSADVTVAVAGHAGSDLTLDEASLTFTVEKWNEAQTVTVMAAEDADASNDEVTLKHTASGGDYGSVVLDVVVTVSDDDSPGLVVAPAAVTVAEADDPETPAKEHQGTYTVKLATEPSADVTVAIAGHAGSDLTLDKESLTFTVEKWNEAQTVTVTAAEDDDAANDEVTLKHTASGGDYGSVSADVVVTVEDDDERPTGIKLSAVPDSVTENGGAQTIAVTATVTGGRYTEAKTVTVSVSDGTAESPADYAAVADFDITIGAGAGSASGSFTLTPVDDAVDEGDETIAVTGVSGALTITPETITITDNDEAPTGITLSAVPDSVTENGGAQTITVTATVTGGRYTEAKTVTVRVSDGTAESPVDYAAVANFDITIGAGAGSASGSFTLTPVDDTVDEGDETIAVTGVSGSLTITSDTITITDNDTVGLVVRPSSLTVGEGASASYTVALATEPTGTVTVAIGGTTGTDLSVDDASLEFTPSSWGTAQRVTVSAGEDADTANDTATLRHTASGGGYGSVTADVAVTVIDDDELSTAVDLTLDPTEVSEGAEPTGVTVTAALNAATLPTDVIVEVTVAAGSAGAEDFAAVTPFALTIGAGETGATAAFTFTPVDDVIDEPDETVTVSGRVPESTLTVTPAVLTILDDDETPAISIADASAVESAGEIVFPVTLSGVSARTITVSYRTADGTAEAGADYEAGDGELSFAPGETERSVTIAVIDDALDEADETFLVQLGEPEHATVADGEATGTITDEDQTPLITIEDASEVESSEGIGFVVTLDGPSGRPISVVCRSADGTATAGDDYVEELGVLTFEPGETQKTIRMELIDDVLDEGDEQFLLNLSEPVNVRLAAEVVSAVGTIKDDDAAVTVAWLARFGRTVTQQVLEAVGERTQGGSALGSQVSLAGHRVSADALVVGGDEEQAESDVLSGRSGDYRIMSGGEFLAASSFLVAMDPGAVDQAGGVTEEAAEGVRWTVWGRGAASGFEGLDEDGRLSIDGSVLTGLAGVDADLGGWLGGLAVGRSDGTGGYGWAGDADRPAREGDLEAELTSVYPYVRVPVADWLSVWGVFGYGVGELRQVEEVRLEEQTQIGMLLGALGGRGELLTAEAGGGLGLAVKADGYLLRMTSESTPVLPTVEADVMRLRLTAEGSGQVRIGSGLVVRPSVEVGVRHDGGDVENGTGLELGGGLSLTDLRVGLALTGNARVLVTHEDRGYREWGAAGSLSFDPGAPGRGLAVKVDSSYGAAAAGGVEQLWSQGAADLTGAAVPVGRVGAEVGYGVAENDWSVRPYAGVEIAGDSPEWRVGTRFGLGAQDVTVEGTGSAAVADSNLTIQYSVRW